jgi:hypothetical protein
VARRQRCDRVARYKEGVIRGSGGAGRVAGGRSAAHEGWWGQATMWEGGREQ